MTPSSEFHHLLVCLDGSACSARALREALALAQADGARLSLLHVVRPWAYVQDPASALSAWERGLTLMREAGERLLAEAGAQALALGLTADAVLWMPQGQGRQRLWEIVNEQAQLSGADLVVIGSHGHRGARHAVLGSNAEQILRHAGLPVLVVKTQAMD